MQGGRKAESRGEAESWRPEEAKEMGVGRGGSQKVVEKGDICVFMSTRFKYFYSLVIYVSSRVGCG